MSEEAWFKIVGSGSAWNIVSLKGITYVAHLKNVIKQIGSPRLDRYYVGDLTIKAQKEKDDDEEKAVELDETAELGTALEHGIWLLVYPTVGE